ncbi:SsgA family sporulation/cell division regulator [Streptomyces sp. NPDC002734]|uniref:SsgA family sporulation/cell division regulator n=1 Tax=Streptomyces sp. NPDC002734 TaxID=3154426 RepID=UPI003324DFDC
MRTVVERELTMTLIVSAEQHAPVTARLRYGTDDPFAVHVAFHSGTDRPVRWSFARDLLMEGRFRACGQGDVRVWPGRGVEGGAPVMLLALSSPCGDALLEAPAGEVAGWLAHTLRMVPRGREGELLDLDGPLAELLALE